MSDHLNSVTSIFARETATINYLRSIGIEHNVVKMVDPAFAMEPREPVGGAGSYNLSHSIGINLSPLMARYCSHGDETAWLGRAVDIVSALDRQFNNPILLIPHVVEDNSDDWSFLEKVREAVGSPKVCLLAKEYSAAELKWFISKLLLLAAARTHATIAGFSSGVPTITFAYSTKAFGINQDIYGHQDLCIHPDQLCAEVVYSKIKYVVDNNSDIKQHIAKMSRMMVQDAFNAGKILKEVIAA